MNTLDWMLCVGFGVAGALFVFMSSMAIRIASRVNDLEHKLRASRQAHALDVLALTKKLQKLQRQGPPQ